MAFAHTYIYILYTPNLGLVITAFVREREQVALEGVTRDHGGALESRGEHKGSTREHRVSTEGAKNSLRAKIGGEARLYELTVAASS
jgi:hypothetical protein